MSLLNRFMTRSLRPGAFNSPTSIHLLRRHPLTPTTKSIAPNFYTSSLSHSQHLGRRAFNTRQYQTVSALNRGILFTLLGANCAIFLYASYAKQQAQHGFPKNLTTFYRNFTINYDEVVREGRWWTVLTSTFSHVDLFHLLGNLMSAFYLGSMVANTPGVKPLQFAALIFGSAISGSIGYLGFRRQKIEEAQREMGTSYPPRDPKRGLGFSGAVMGIGASAAIMYPKTTLHIWGIIPMPLWALMLGYAVFDGYYLNDSSSRTAHSGHLGGLAFGLAFHVLAFRRLRIPNHPIV